MLRVANTRNALLLELQLLNSSNFTYFWLPMLAVHTGGTSAANEKVRKVVSLSLKGGGCRLGEAVDEYLEGNYKVASAKLLIILICVGRINIFGGNELLHFVVSLAGCASRVHW